MTNHPLWQTQFNAARFDVPAIIASDARVEDVSYGNDVCPSFVAAGADLRVDQPTLFVDAVEPADRESDGAARFTVVYRDYSIAFESETDAAGAVAALLAAHAAELARIAGTVPTLARRPDESIADFTTRTKTGGAL